jgi:hypothetical protein
VQGFLFSPPLVPAALEKLLGSEGAKKLTVIKRAS